MMHSHVLAPCGWTTPRVYARSRTSAYLLRPRGAECDGCQQEGVTYYDEGGVSGPLCRVTPYSLEERQEATRSPRRRQEVAVGDEVRERGEQARLW